MSSQLKARLWSENRQTHQVLVPEIKFVLPADRRLRLLCIRRPLSSASSASSARSRYYLPLNMSSRAGLRFFQSARLSRALSRKPFGRRYQATDATTASSEGIVQRLWNSPVGMKTVHFW